MLKEALRGVLEESELIELSSAFDVIGDIAIIKIPKSLESRSSLIGEQIIERMKNVSTVLSQESDISGEFRVRELSFVAGEERYETIYKESECRFKVNVRSVYFSPRLSTERLRIASLANDGEKIFNMFAGLGTFSFIIAKQKECIIDSVDKNPEAVRLAFESLKLNRKLKGVVRPVLADASEFARKHKGDYDRVIMPLPERSFEFLEDAINSTRKEAIIHYYVHVPLKDFKETSWIENHLEKVVKSKRRYKVRNWKRVREVGPRYIQAVADIALE
ncbi:MAG: class I SAM-dependent methyltransferase [Nitrososphaerales archaeon]